jgi:Ca-activated chloride channel family protein
VSCRKPFHAYESQEDPVHVSTNLDVDLVAVESADQVNLLLELQAPQLPEQATRAAQTLVVVLDRSGSMGGEPLEASRRALTTLIGRLDPRDRFGLVVFDDHADVVVPAAPLDFLGLDKVKEAIAGIYPGGSTDLSAGYLLGLSEAGRAMGNGSATVLIISDGHANSGETSPVVLGDLAEGRANKRITTTTIGYGLGYDEELLVAIARGGNGDHVFAEDVDQLHPAVAEQVGGLLAKAVTATSVTIRPLGLGLAGVRVLHDVPAAQIGDEVIAQLGDLYQGESRRLLIQLDIPAMAALGLATVAEVAVRYTELPGLIEHVITLPVTVNVVPGDVAAGRVPDPVVTVERLLQQAQQSKRDAITSLRAGKTDTAQYLLTGAMHNLSAPMAALEPQARAALDEEIGELRRLSELTHQGNTERSVKSSYASMSQRSRSRRPRPTDGAT